MVGVPRPEGLRAVAFVIPADGCEVDEARLNTHLRTHLAPCKIPARFFPIDEFPVTVSANATTKAGIAPAAPAQTARPLG